jgi:hypothetical protein
MRQGQPHRNLGAASHARLDVEIALVHFDDAPGEGQPQPHALLLRSHRPACQQDEGVAAVADIAYSDSVAVK